MTVKPRPARATSIFDVAKQDVKDSIIAHPAVNMPVVIVAVFRLKYYSFKNIDGYLESRFWIAGK